MRVGDNVLAEVQTVAGKRTRSHDAGDGSFQNGMTINELGDVKVLFVLGFGPVVREPVASRRLYAEDLGIRFAEEAGGYLHTEARDGSALVVTQRRRKGDS